jgi:hypothetical protein
MDPFGINLLGDMQYKTTVTSATGTRIHYNRHRYENGARVSYIEKSINNQVFNRMTTLRLTVSWESAQILNDAILSTIVKVLDERSDFIFRTIGSSCPLLENLDITCRAFKTPFMSSKERRSSPRPYICPFPHCICIEALPASMKHLKLTNFRVRIEDFGLLRTNNLLSITMTNCGDDLDTAAVKDFLITKCNENCKISVEKKQTYASYF